LVLDMEPVAEKWRSFGWDTLEIDGNDLAAITAALAAARGRDGKPKAIALRTQPGKDVPRIEKSEKSHFFRCDVAEWESIIAEFESSVRAGT
jgi:transketolase